MTGARDPERFPDSTAYRARPDVVRVSGTGLQLAYGQISILYLIGEGVSPGAAGEIGYALWRRLVAASSLRVAPVPPGMVVVGTRIGQRHSSCLADSAERVRVAIAQPWENFCRQGLDRWPPAAWITPTDRGAVVWLEETVRRVGEGSELRQAARGAYDAHLGKPRQRRPPVDAGWLQGQLEDTLIAIWFALLHARVSKGEGGYWFHDLLDEDQPPIWQPGTAGRR